MLLHNSIPFLYNIKKGTGKRDKAQEEEGGDKHIYMNTLALSLLILPFSTSCYLPWSIELHVHVGSACFSFHKLYVVLHQIADQDEAMQLHIRA